MSFFIISLIGIADASYHFDTTACRQLGENDAISNKPKNPDQPRLKQEAFFAFESIGQQGDWKTFEREFLEACKNQYNMWYDSEADRPAPTGPMIICDGKTAYENRQVIANSKNLYDVDDAKMCIEDIKAKIKAQFFNPFPYVECKSGNDTCPSLGCTINEAETNLDKIKEIRAELALKSQIWGLDSQTENEIDATLRFDESRIQQCVDYFGQRESDLEMAKDIGEQFGITEEDVVEFAGGEENVKAMYDQNCLIATASFGSPMAKEVQLLREIRDNQLLQTKSGYAFMTGFNAFYYSFAPTVAQWEHDSPVFKEIVKTTITPLIASMSLLNFVNMDSEAEVLTYGISIILLNVGMYFAAPAVVIWQVRKRYSRFHDNT